MKVKELIEKLQAFDPELTVTYTDSEYGTYTVTDPYVDEDAYVYWDKATVLNLGGDYIEKEHVDSKFFRKQERPKTEPSPVSAVLANAYRDVFERQLENSLMFSRLNHPSNTVNEGAFVEFKIIKGDKK